MPRGTKDDMQVNVAGLRRNIKNLAHNYSDAQVKVREATSNDPWGPSSTLMAEIADLTYNVMAFTEIMQMIWKRLNDHGKNWRHVYKALVLMEYLIKTGTEKVAMQCKENIFAIHTLKDFQCLEDGRDQGLNVREKAKQLFILLKDDERLKNERARALKAKERFAQSASAFGSDGALETPSSPAFPTMGSSSRDRDREGAWCGSGSGSVASAVALGELETARPQTAGEEELQLQLALAVSREEAERDERRRRSDNVRLQLALSQSEQDFNTDDFRVAPGEGRSKGDTPQQSHLLDLLDVNVGNPLAHDHATASGPLDPWGAPPTPPQRPQTMSQSPLQNMLSSPSSDLEFDIITNRSRSALQNGSSNNINNNHSNGGTLSPDPFDLTLLGDHMGAPNANSTGFPPKKTPQSFLGENSALVNLDNLIKPTNGTGNEPLFGTSAVSSLAHLPANPFTAEVQQSRPNLFQNQTQPRLTMNEIKQQPFATVSVDQDPWAPAPATNSPWAPIPSNPKSTTPNPFLS